MAIWGKTFNFFAKCLVGLFTPDWKRTNPFSVFRSHPSHADAYNNNNTDTDKDVAEVDADGDANNDDHANVDAKSGNGRLPYA